MVDVSSLWQVFSDAGVFKIKDLTNSVDRISIYPSNTGIRINQKITGLVTPTNASDATNKYYVDYAISNEIADGLAGLVGAAPSTLDTLQELADALGDDPNFATTIIASLGQKDVSIAWLNTNKANLTDLEPYATNASVGLAIQDFATNPSVNTALTQFIKNVSIGTGLYWNAGYLNASTGGGGITGDYILSSSIGSTVLAYRTFGTAANNATGDFVAARSFGTAANNNTGDFVATYSNSGLSDLNTITVSGMYRLNAGQANAPTGVEYGQMIVAHGSGDTISQIAMAYHDNLIYWRNGNPTDCGGSGSWNAWKRLWNSGDFAISDYAPLASPTFTGNVGIGASPGSRLEVSASGVNGDLTAIRITNTYGNTYALTSGVKYATETGFSIRNVTAGTTPFIIGGDDNILIPGNITAANLGTASSHATGDFLGASATAVNSDKLDSWHSTDFAKLNDSNVFAGTATFNYEVSTGGDIHIGMAYKRNLNFNSNGLVRWKYYPSNTASRSWQTGNDSQQFGDFIIQQSTTQTGASYATKLYFTAAGNMAIGDTTANYLLSLPSNSAGKPGTGGLWTVVSDERIKTNIELANLDRCYEIVKTIPLKRFRFDPSCYTDEQIKDRGVLGWIAQDVQPVFPKAVGVHDFTLPKPKDASDGYQPEVIKDCLDLDGGQINAALYGAVQKLMEKVEMLEMDISTLKKNK